MWQDTSMFKADQIFLYRQEKNEQANHKFTPFISSLDNKPISVFKRLG